MSPGKSTSRDVPSETSPTRNQETKEEENHNEEQSPEFEFRLSYKEHDAVSCYSMLSPDELFCNGEIVPLLSHPKLLVLQHRLSEKNKNMKTSFVNRHKIMVPKTSQPSQFCAVDDIAASPVSIPRDWKSLKMDDNGAASPHAETVRRYSQWPGRSRKNLCYSRTVLAKICSRSISVRAAKTAKSLKASAQSVLKRSKREPWAAWCCSTAVVPATVSVSPTGATANASDAFSRLKLNDVDINARPVGDVQTVTYVSPLRVDLPDAEKSPIHTIHFKEFYDLKGNDCPPPTYPAKKSVNGRAESTGSRQTYFPRSHRDIICIRNEDYTEKAAVRNADRINASFRERRNFLTAELNRNGKIRRQERSLRHYEKYKIYQRNAQVTQVLHMNGCMGKSLSSHKIRFTERSFSDYSNKTTSKYNIDRY